MLASPLAPSPRANPNPGLAEFQWFSRVARPPRLRALSEFAEREVVIPKGKYRGSRLRYHRQPYVRLLFEAIDSGQWTRFAVVGCVQSGKTLCGLIVPLLYYLFERKETVICGVPVAELAADKWREEIRPAIRASQYHRWLPRQGKGSRDGGNLDAVAFRNGATLKFMTGRSRDEKRSAFTSRIVVVTEVDKMDEGISTSRETDPISQLEARTASYSAEERRLFLECTVSVPTGRIWQEYQAGTQSRIVCRCPHCGDWVTPEREHLLGWKEAASKKASAEAAYWACPSCGQVLTEHERAAMNLGGVLVHRGQEIDPEGHLHGPLPETDTLGFRWNAFNNLFWSAGDVAREEWAALHGEDLNEDETERKLRQFYWAVPWEPPEFETAPLKVETLRRRLAESRRGFVPAGVKCLTMGVDLGKWVSYWVLVAWFDNGGGVVVDYGTFEVPSKDQDVALALLAALRTFRDETVERGWPMAGGEARVPEQVWIDSGYKPEPVHAFVREAGNRYRACLGLGIGQHYQRRYTHPGKVGGNVRHLGQEYHVVWRPEDRAFVIEVNADGWKRWLHDRLATPPDQPGALVLYHTSDPREHTSYCKQLTAERHFEEFLPGKGTVIRWERLSRANHLLDASYLACAAGHLCGVRVVPQPKPPVPSRTPAAAAVDALRTPGGQPFMLTERLHGEAQRRPRV